MRWLNGILIAAALLAVIPACSGSIANGNYRRTHWIFRIRTNTGAKVPAGAADRYLAFEGTKRKPGLAFVQFNRDLWKPFRYEATAGRFDPAGPTARPGFFGIEVDRRGTSPPDFSGIFVAPLEDGRLQVFAARPDGETLGQLVLAPTDTVDVAIEHDGATLRFLVRPEGDETYTEVAAQPFATQDEPLIPSLFVNDIEKGTEVGYDNLRVTFNGAPPPGSSRRKLAARAANDVMDPILEAVYAMDGTAPDRPAADDHLLDALSALDTATEPVKAVGGGRSRKAAKQLAGCRKKVEGARALAGSGGSEEDVLDLLAKALKKAGKAVRILDKLTHR
jgi:hypothetical protein